LRIAFDIDGCLANFTQGYADLIRTTSGRDLLTPEMIANPPCWNWDIAVGYTKEEVGAAWGRIKADPYFWRNLRPLDGEVFHTIEELAWTHDIYFLTHRMGYKAKSQTEYWLDNWGVENPTVLLAGDKLPVLRALEVDLFIDDKPDTLEQIGTQMIQWMDDPLPPTFKLYKVNYTYNATAPGIGVASVAEMLEREGL
jgi:5'(3')-deoxyribonucleotidase